MSFRLLRWGDPRCASGSSSPLTEAAIATPSLLSMAISDLNSLTKPRHLLHVFPSFAVGGSQMRFGQLVAAHGSRYRHTVLALDGDFRSEFSDQTPTPVACLSVFCGGGIPDALRAARRRSRKPLSPHRPCSRWRFQI